jgi:hypothetical protein
MDLLVLIQKSYSKEEGSRHRSFKPDTSQMNAIVAQGIGSTKGSTSWSALEAIPAARLPS